MDAVEGKIETRMAAIIEMKKKIEDLRARLDQTDSKMINTGNPNQS